MAGGRPLKYKNVKAIQKDIDMYFDECDKDGRPYTVSGLAFALGTNRQTLINYEEKEEFFDTIKNAKARIEMYNEELLYDKNAPTAGVIFNLKNNYGWKDKQEIEADVKNDMTISIELSDD